MGYVKFDTNGERIKYLVSLTRSILSGGEVGGDHVQTLERWITSGTEEEQAQRWATLLVTVGVVMAGTTEDWERFKEQRDSIREHLIAAGILVPTDKEQGNERTH